MGYERYCKSWGHKQTFRTARPVMPTASDRSCLSEIADRRPEVPRADTVALSTGSPESTHGASFVCRRSLQLSPEEKNIFLWLLRPKEHIRVPPSRRPRQSSSDQSNTNRRRSLFGIPLKWGGCSHVNVSWAVQSCIEYVRKKEYLSLIFTADACTEREESDGKQ